MTSTIPVQVQRKHIVLVEDDQLEVELASFDLGPVFCQDKITLVRHVGDFLLSADQLRNADIVVMEHFLPLGELKDSEETTTAWFKNLAERFPVTTNNWNHRDGGERLVRWMRSSGFAMPVLFHTHSDVEDIAVDVRRDPKVFYQRKSITRGALCRAVEDVLAKK